LQGEDKEKHQRRKSTVGGIGHISAGYITNLNECITATSPSSAYIVSVLKNVIIECINVFKTYRPDKNNSGFMRKKFTLC
jgi:hypothetical protein